MNDRGIAYFGEPDASIVDSGALGKQHIQRGIERRIKYGGAREGRQAIVGVKGSGKTDLRKHIENSGPAYVFNLNADRFTLTLDASASVNDTSGRIKTVVSMILLRGFAKQVGAQGNSAPKKALLKVLETSTQVLKNLPDSVELNAAGFGKLSLGKLLNIDAAEWVQSAFDKLIAGIIPALENKRGYILIDDVEDVFPGIVENPIFLEGVVRSVKDINNAAGDRLHALIFIKHGLWKSWAETRRREYDKVRNIIDHIRWDRESLVELIARRIAARRPGGDRNLSVEQLWKSEFEWDGDFEAFTQYIASFCVNGPRDMIELCNLAATAATGERITLNDFRKCIGDFSDDKFYGLEEDYGDLYQGITSFVEVVFRECDETTLQGTKLSEYIEATTMADPDAEKESFYRETWFTDRTRQRLAVLLYEIGVVGFGIEPNVTYAIESPTISQSDLMAQKNIVIHPAFRPHLEIAR